MSNRVDVIAIAHNMDLHIEMGFTSFCPLHTVKQIVRNRMAEYCVPSYDLTFQRDGVTFEESTIFDDEFLSIDSDVDYSVLETA